MFFIRSIEVIPPKLFFFHENVDSSHSYAGRMPALRLEPERGRLVRFCKHSCSSFVVTIRSWAVICFKLWQRLKKK
ncbi:MAG: hypothetical protein C4527_23740 [Candidatus Omnitrophota bacterium]|nr:MAG: hypothetical protein C4527_23740 [Candidatus Omnitrophota bacterium]